MSVRMQPPSSDCQESRLEIAWLPSVCFRVCLEHLTSREDLCLPRENEANLMSSVVQCGSVEPCVSFFERALNCRDSVGSRCLPVRRDVVGKTEAGLVRVQQTFFFFYSALVYLSFCASTLQALLKLCTRFPEHRQLHNGK